MSRPATAPSVHWIDSAEGLEHTVTQLLTQHEYAIDTEFHRERTYFPHLALIQICWNGQTVLIDPLALDLAPLRAVFESDAVAVFHAADQDLEVLQHGVGAVPKNIWDTQLAAGFVGFSTPSLSSLAERILKVQLSKGDRLTDWTQRPLTAAQCTYAAADVQYLAEIRSQLLAQLDAAGRTEWVDEEIALLKQKSTIPTIPEHAWWRLKDGRVLRGKDRIVAQQLCIWRDQRARVEDRPLRFVLPDLAVLAIAQAKPTSVEQLGALRGLDGRFLKGGVARELLEVVRTSQELPKQALKVPEPEDFDRRLRPALTLISAWVAQLSRDAKIDTSLLATRSDLVAFLRNDEGARLARGWRNDIVGSAVRQLVSGEASLTFDTNAGLLLEKRSGATLKRSLTTPDAPWVLDAPDHRSDDADV